MTEQTILALGSIIMAGLTMAIGAVGAAIGESRIGAAGLDAIARQPDEVGSITRNQFVALAMVESNAIFCLVIALTLLFANPFVVAG
jgi:F-type H+-transporting ATPase subunit c